jgi:purine-binding chemotaxis protein CheW
MGNDNQFVLFTAEGQQFALPLHSVDRVLQIVKFEPLPKTPDYICGVINLEGDLIPVINIRKIFLLPAKDYSLSDQLIIFFTGIGRMALWVDAVLETLILKDEDISSQNKLFLEVSCLDGISDFNNQVVLISDPDKFIERAHIKMIGNAIESLRKT